MLSPLEATMFKVVKYSVYMAGGEAVMRQGTKLVYRGTPKEERGTAPMVMTALLENKPAFDHFPESSGPMPLRGAPSAGTRHGTPALRTFDHTAPIPTPERLTDKYRHVQPTLPPGGGTYNNLSANTSVTRPDFDGSNTVKRMISGECIPSQQLYKSHVFRVPSPMEKNKAVTSMDLITSLVMRNAEAGDYVKRLYQLTDDEVREMFHERQSLSARRLEHAPETMGGRWNPLAMFRIVSASRTPANMKVIITRSQRSQQHEWDDTDGLWGLQIVSSGFDYEQHKVENPVAGHNMDSLTNFIHFTTHEDVQLEQTSRQFFRKTEKTVGSLQAAIKRAEELGYDWEVRADRGFYWPANRHKLYTDNFPFRGNFKKPFSDLSAKRQKGGDWALAKRREFCPTTVNHFDSKTEEDLFA